MVKITNLMSTTIDINTIKASNSLKSLNTAIKATTNAWKANEAQAKSTGDYYAASKSRFEGLSKNIENVRSKIKYLTEEQSKMDRSTKSGQDNYNKYTNKIAQAEKQLSSMIAQQKRARSSLSYESSGLAELQKHYRESTSLNKSYVDRLESEGKTYLANKARVSGYRNSIANLTKQYEAQSKELNRIASESGKTSSAYKVQQTRVNETATAINKAKSAVSGLESENRKLNPSIWDKIKSKLSGVNEKAVETHKTLKEVFMGSALGNVVSNAASNLGSSLKSAYEEGMQLNLGLAKINGRFKSMGMNNREIKALDKQIGELKANTDLAGDSASDLQAHMLNWSTIGTKGAMQMAKTVAGIGDSSKLSGQQIAQLSASLMRVGSTGKVTYSSLSRITKAAPSFMETLARGAGMSQSKLRDLLKTGNVTQKQFQTWMANASKYADESFKGYSQTQAGALKSMTVARQKLEQEFTKPIFDAKTSGLQALKDIMTSKEVMSGANQLGKAISNTIGYLDKHKADITGVTKDVVSLGVSIGKETWKDATGIFMDIGKSFGLIRGNAKKSKDPLHVLKLSMDGLAKNKTAIQWISKAIIAMAAAKGISHVGMGLLGVANNGYKAYKNIKALRNGFKGLQDLKDLKGPEHAFAHLGQTIGKLAPKVKGLFNQKGGAGKLSGLLQSAHSAGGFSKLSTAGKIGTGLAGAGVAVDTATSIVKAIKDKVGSRKQYEDVGTAAGKGIGGAIGLYFAGPAGAAIGAKIGGIVGKWGGDAVKSFQNGWNKKKPPRKFWSLENLGWSTHDTLRKVGKWGSDVGQNFQKGVKSADKGMRSWQRKSKRNISNFFKGIGKNTRSWAKSNEKEHQKMWDAIYKHSSKGTRKIMRAHAKFTRSYLKTEDKAHKDTIKNFENFGSRLRKNHGDLFKTMGQTAHKQLQIERKRWSSHFKQAQAFAKSSWKGIEENAHSFYNGLNRSTHGGLGKVASTVHSWGTGIKNFWGNLLKGIKQLWDDTIGAIDKSAKNVQKFFAGKLKVGNIHLASGTDWKKKYGYPAILNDGNDSPSTGNREGILNNITGDVTVQQGRNVRRWIFPWEDVINAHDLAILTGHALHHATGSIDLNKLTSGLKLTSGPNKYLERLAKLSDDHNKILKSAITRFRSDQEKENRKRDKKRAEDKKHRDKRDKERKQKDTKKSKQKYVYVDKSIFSKNPTKLTGKYEKISEDRLDHLLDPFKYIAKKQAAERKKRQKEKEAARKKRRKEKEAERKRRRAEKKRTRSRRTTTTRRSTSSRSTSSNRVSEISISSARATASVSVKGASKVKSLEKALKRLKSRKISVHVSSKGTSKANKSIRRLTSRLKKVPKKKSIKLSIKGTSSINRSVKSVGSHLTSLHRRVDSLTKATRKDKFGNAIKKQAEEAVKSLKGKGNFAKTFEGLTKKFDKDLKSMSSYSTNEFKKMWDSNESEAKKGQKHVLASQHTFSRNFEKAWRSMNSGTQSIYRKFWNSMQNTAGKGLNSVLRVLNSGISKIDTVIANFGGNKSAVNHVGYVHYASGTGAFSGPRRAIVRPTLAMLNDGHDSPETGNRETVWDTVNNKFYGIHGTNVPALLQPGMEVFNATESKLLGFTHYASGTGALKKLYEEAKKFWKNPLKTGDSQFGKVTGLTGAINNLAQGAKKLGQAQGIKWWIQLWKMVENKVNSDAGPASGLLKAVEELGRGKKYSENLSLRYGPDYYDCSGLVSKAMNTYYHKHWGPLDVAGLWTHAHRIPRSEAKPGDPIFWLPDYHVGVFDHGDWYWSAFGPGAHPQVGMHRISGSVTGVRPTFARFDNTDTTSDKSKNKDVKVKANNKLQKFIRPQVGKGFWKTIQKITDKFGPKDSLIGEFGLHGPEKNRVRQLAAALKKADPKATRAGIAAIVGNAMWESAGLQPGIVNSIGAAGLWQFYKERRVGLNNYARRHHMNWRNAATQIDYALNADSLRALFKQILEGHGSAYNLAWKFSHDWEVGGADDIHARHGEEAYKILGYANGGIISKPQLAMIGEGNGPETIVPWDITKRAKAYQLMNLTLKHFKQQDDPTDQSGDSKILLEILKVMTSIEKKLDAEINETRRLGEQPINVSGDFNVDGRKFARYLRTYLREFDRQTVVRGRYNLSDR